GAEVAVLDAGQQAGSPAAGVDRDGGDPDGGEPDRVDAERAGGGGTGEEQALAGADGEQCLCHGVRSRGRLRPSCHGAAGLAEFWEIRPAITSRVIVVFLLSSLMCRIWELLPYKKRRLVNCCVRGGSGAASASSIWRSRPASPAGTSVSWRPGAPGPAGRW